MTSKKHAAQVAVKAAALPKPTPRDVLDCIAAGIPRDDWEATLDNDEACAWSNWLAQGKQPQSETVSLMPSVGQIQYMAVALMLSSLSSALNHIAEDWGDAWLDAIHATELANDRAQELQAKLPMGGNEFCQEFFRLQSVVRLAAAAFHERESVFVRHLKGASESFVGFFESLDMAGAFELKGAAA